MWRASITSAPVGACTVRRARIAAAASAASTPAMKRITTTVAVRNTASTAPITAAAAQAMAPPTQAMLRKGPLTRDCVALGKGL